jgi:hypothetical protein
LWAPLAKGVFIRRYDIQLGDTRHNDIQHNGLVRDTQQKQQYVLSVPECISSVCNVLSIGMLNDIMLNVDMLRRGVVYAAPRLSTQRHPP